MTSLQNAAYQELESRFARLYALREAAGVLHWDMSTVMPEGGAEARTEQLTALDLVCHEIIVDPRTAELLDRAEEGGAARLEPWQAANLAEMRREWHHDAAVPGDLVEALSRAGKACEMAWRAARPAADFARVLPQLKTLVSRVRELAAAKSETMGLSPYDALLDLYEPGGRSARIDCIFDDLARFLPDFLEQVLTRQKSVPVPLALSGPFPRAAQESLGRKIMGQVGFEFDHGRLDQSLHPFCGGVPDDVRITTRYDEDDFTKALMGVIHETGHALYERGLPKSWRRQPVGQARGMSLHESQSLLMEMQACRSAEFFAFLAPLARQIFGTGGPAWSAENLQRLYNRVKPDFIRVDADEVTYPAHIILRYRLEKDLVAGAMEAEDIPEAWNGGMQELLGVRPPDDAKGCLQDIHWYDGAWGYFPTYTLGAMTAAQLFQAACEAEPDIPVEIGKGHFAPLLSWLRRNVHEKASSKSGERILVEATGRALDPECFKVHLRRRYLDAAS